MSDRPVDPFAGLTLHHLRVDWTDLRWDRHTLTELFMGDHYWERYPRFRESQNQFGPAGEKMTPVEYERALLAELPPRKWAGNSKVGKPVYQHMLTLIKLMFPQTDITDTLADAVMFFCYAVAHRKKMLNLIGGQNMSKTAATVRLAFVTMFINPEFTKWIVANPFEKSAEDTVWGEIEILWDDLLRDWPYEYDRPLLFPEAVKYKDYRIEFIRGKPRVGKIHLQRNKHTGHGKGAKSRKGADNEDVGIFGEIIDEVNEIDSQAFLKTVQNKSSQKNYIAITSQNFKDPEDMGGQITEPSGEYGGPNSFEALNVDDDLWWHSAFSGITLRFDGHNSANILAGRIIYSYLFDEEDRQRLAAGGTEHPNYMSQVRSFPCQGATANALLSKPKLSASRHMDTFYAVIGNLVGVSFCDPAFGGRDDAVWGYAKFGRFQVTDASNNKIEQDLIIFPEHFITLKLVRPGENSGRFNDFWRRRYQAMGLDVSDETEGAEISYEDQIAIQCLEQNRQRGIPSENFGYDFSMRPDIVSSMNKIVGFASQAFNYNQPPEGVPLINFKGKSKEQDEDSKALCKNRCTELGMLAADMFLSKCVRGGENIPTAIVQLCRTHLLDANRKYVIESKDEYKKRWNNVSPDHRDVFLGISGMAARRGFRAALKPANRPSSSSSVYALLKKSPRFRSRTVAKLPKLPARS